MITKAENSCLTQVLLPTHNVIDKNMAKKRISSLSKHVKFTIIGDKKGGPRHQSLGPNGITHHKTTAAAEDCLRFEGQIYLNTQLL